MDGIFKFFLEKGDLNNRKKLSLKRENNSSYIGIEIRIFGLKIPPSKLRQPDLT
jgi:hypothetical protein